MIVGSLLVGILFICIVGYCWLQVEEKLKTSQKVYTKIGELQSQLSDSEVRLSQLEEEKLELTKKFEKLRHQ